MKYQRINLNKLYYFYVVAQEGSVKAASKLLNLTQPTISGQIRELEENLGFDLFIRKHRKLELSKAGNEVLKTAHEIFRLAEDLGDKAQLSQKSERLVIRIGAIQSLSNSFINDFSTKIWRDETIQVNVAQGRLDDLVKMLDSGQIDILLTDSPISLSKKYQSLPLGHDTMVAVAPPRLKIKKSSFPQSINGVPYIAFSNEGLLQQEIDYYFERNGVETDLIGRVDDVTLMRVITESSECFSILPKKSIQESVKAKKLKVISEIKGLELSLWAIIPKVSAQRLVIKKVINRYFKQKKGLR